MYTTMEDMQQNHRKKRPRYEVLNCLQVDIMVSPSWIRAIAVHQVEH